MNINVQLIYSVEMVCEGTYYSPINIKYHYYVSPKNKLNNTIVSLRSITNGNVHVKCYDSKDVVNPYLRNFSQNDSSLLIPLHAPIE